MAVHSFSDLMEHVGHKIKCVTYGKPGEPPVNVSLECETCNTVLVTYDAPRRGYFKPAPKTGVRK